jgi:N-acetylmuramoyl-L-alanine amidase
MYFLRCISKRYSIWLGILLVANVVGVTAVYAKPVVFDVRSYDHGEFTRFVIDLSEKVEHKKILQLMNPYRIVIDLPGLIWQAPPERQSEKGGLIASFHHGLFNAGTYRVVINLQSSAVVKKLFMLPPRESKPHRLVVDLMSSTRRAMLSNRAMEPIRNQMNTSRPFKTIKFAAPKRKPQFVDVSQMIVVIDPGHGGIDPGATTSSGLLEKNIVLLAAKFIKSAFERTGRHQVYLTRETDKFVRLRKRFEIAQNKRAGVFLSLHADSIKSKKIGGMSLYTLSNKASSREAARLAKKENEFELRAGYAFDDVPESETLIQNMLLEMSKKGFRKAQMVEMEESNLLAKELNSELRKIGKMLPNSVRSAGFAVLKSPDHPSVLIELGFLSNPKDVRNLQSKSHLKRIASAIVKAVDGFCSRTSNPCKPTFHVGRN